MDESWSAIKSVFSPDQENRSRPKKRQKLVDKFRSIGGNKNVSIEVRGDENSANRLDNSRLASNKQNYSQLQISSTKPSHENFRKGFSKQGTSKRKSSDKQESNILRPSSVPNLNRSVKGDQDDFSRMKGAFCLENAAKDQKLLEQTIVDSGDDDSTPPPEQRTKSDGRNHSQISLSNSSSGEPSQISIRTPSTESIHFPSQIAVGNPAVIRKGSKQVAAKKGGLLEALRKVKKRTKSDLSFWLHEKHAEIASPGEKCKIESITKTYGRVLVRGRSCEKENETKTFCVDPSLKRLAQLSTGQIIDIQFDTGGHKLSLNETFYPFVDKIYF